MWKRVIAPAALASGVWLICVILDAAYDLLWTRTLDELSARRDVPVYLPILPRLGWVVFPAVFLAVHACAVRRGSRGERILVGLAPALAATVVVGCMSIYLAGGATLRIAAGHVFFDGSNGGVALGTVVAVREYLTQWATLLAICIVATWLHFRAARPTGQRSSPAPAPNE